MGENVGFSMSEMTWAQLSVRATAAVLLACAALPLRYVAADNNEGSAGEIARVAEAALIAEIFGDNQGAQGWSMAQPKFVRSIVTNGEGQPVSSGASEDCE